MFDEVKEIKGEKKLTKPPLKNDEEGLSLEEVALQDSVKPLTVIMEAI